MQQKTSEHFTTSLRYLFHTTNICLDNKKLSCCCDSRSHCVRRAVYWQTIKLVSELQV